MIDVETKSLEVAKESLKEVPGLTTIDVGCGPFGDLRMPEEHQAELGSEGSLVTSEATSTRGRLSVRVPRELGNYVKETINDIREIRLRGDESPIGANGTELLVLGLDLLRSALEARPPISWTFEDMDCAPISLRREPTEAKSGGGFSLFCPLAASNEEEYLKVNLNFSPKCRHPIDNFRRYCGDNGLQITISEATRWALRAAVLHLPYILTGWKIGVKTENGFIQTWPDRAQEATAVAKSEPTSEGKQKERRTPANYTRKDIRRALGGICRGTIL